MGKGGTFWVDQRLNIISNDSFQILSQHYSLSKSSKISLSELDISTKQLTCTVSQNQTVFDKNQILGHFEKLTFKSSPIHKIRKFQMHEIHEKGQNEYLGIFERLKQI